jgi:adenosylcobinamide-GDP ribazoletransferase
MIRPFLIALQFLTRLPVTLDGVPDNRDIGRSLLYYPLVGLLIGALLAALSWALADAPPLLRAALLLTAWVGITGALHLDGLADSVDAWVGGFGDRERTLAIMKDPNCGPMGVVALVLLLMIKFAALHSVASNDWRTLILAPMLARGAVPLLFLTTPYVRAGGLGASLSANAPRTACAAMIATMWVVILIAAQMRGLWLAIAGIGVLLLLRDVMMKRLGGTTGDTTGAVVELSEAAVLITALLVA